MKPTTAIANTPASSTAAVLERVVIGGDLSALSASDRMEYYRAICASVGLNPLTRPFDFLHLSGKLVLYAKRDATDQLRKLHGVSIIPPLERETLEGLYIVTANARDKDGRIDSAIGAVSIENLRGEAKANAIMKCETKAKRRVTLSICGLGMLDETETGSIPDAQVAKIDHETGEVLDAPLPVRPGEMADARDDMRGVGFAAPLDETLERSLLLAKCKTAADARNLNAKQRAAILDQYGIRDPREASLDSLHGMLEHLRSLSADR